MPIPENLDEHTMNVVWQYMQERAHPDDWRVPCIYIETFRKDFGIDSE